MMNYKKPYYAVIFTSVLSKDSEGYDEMSDLMFQLAKKQNGFLGVESVRENLGITISYWRDLESIKNWKANSAHLKAQGLGKKKWYDSYTTRICKIEHDYHFNKS